MPTFSYSDQVPVASAPPNSSPGAFVTNFTSIDDLIGVDHISFNEASGGTHNQSTYQDKAVTPVPGNQVIVNAKTTSAKCELFMQRNGESAIQLSADAGNPSIGGYPNLNTQGQTFLPGGIIYKWGYVQAVSYVATVNFTTAFPNQCLSATATPVDGASRGIAEGTISRLGFIISTEKPANLVLWMAIGN